MNFESLNWREHTYLQNSNSNKSIKLVNIYLQETGLI